MECKKWDLIGREGERQPGLNGWVKVPRPPLSPAKSWLSACQSGSEFPFRHPAFVHGKKKLTLRLQALQLQKKKKKKCTHPDPVLSIPAAAEPILRWGKACGCKHSLCKTFPFGLGQHETSGRFPFGGSGRGTRRQLVQNSLVVALKNSALCRGGCLGAGFTREVSIKQLIYSPCGQLWWEDLLL